MLQWRIWCRCNSVMLTIGVFSLLSFLEQIYLLLSCAPIQGHVAGIVDIPNACTTIGLPMDIFDFDISPEGALKNGVKAMDMGSCAYTSNRR